MTDKIGFDNLVSDDLGYSARLISLEDLYRLGYERPSKCNNLSFNSNVPEWLYDSDYSYWTMNSYCSGMWCIYSVQSRGNVVGNGYGVNNVLRPVINLRRYSLEEYIEETIEISNNASNGSINHDYENIISEEISENEIIDDNNNADNIDNKDGKKNIISEIVAVSNTLLHSKIYLMIVGLLLVVTSVILVIVIKRLKKHKGE